MKKLRKDPKGNIELFGRKAELMNAFLWERDWKAVTIEELKAITLGELMDGTKRIIVRVNVDGLVALILTDPKDEQASRAKYPSAYIINVAAFGGLFKRASSDTTEQSFSRIVTALSVFQGAKVIR